MGATTAGARRIAARPGSSPGLPARAAPRASETRQPESCCAQSVLELVLLRGERVVRGRVSSLYVVVAVELGAVASEEREGSERVPWFFQEEHLLSSVPCLQDNNRSSGQGVGSVVGQGPAWWCSAERALSSKAERSRSRATYFLLFVAKGCSDGKNKPSYVSPGAWASVMALRKIKAIAFLLINAKKKIFKKYCGACRAGGKGQRWCALVFGTRAWVELFELKVQARTSLCLLPERCNI